MMDKLFPSKDQLEPQIKFNKKEVWNTYDLNRIASIPSKEKIKTVNGKHLLIVKLHCKGIEFNKEVVPKITKTGRPYYERFENEILIGRQNIRNGGIGIVTNEFDGGICSNAINDQMEWGFKGNYRFFRTHTLRKFHASNIQLVAEYIDALQGRSKNSVH